MAYDGKKNQISESYSDSAGIRVCSSAGYAEVKREYDDHRRLTRELYFDETGASVSIPAG